MPIPSCKRSPLRTPCSHCYCHGLLYLVGASASSYRSSASKPVHSLSLSACNRCSRRLLHSLYACRSMVRSFVRSFLLQVKSTASGLRVGLRGVFDGTDSSCTSCMYRNRHGADPFSVVSFFFFFVELDQSRSLLKPFGMQPKAYPMQPKASSSIDGRIDCRKVSHVDKRSKRRMDPHHCRILFGCSSGCRKHTGVAVAVLLTQSLAGEISLVNVG